jgi:transcriptional regulator with XRE-family HTH domain
MAVINGNTASTHFGRQMRKERLARGWSLREFQARTGIDIGQASRIETGKQPPTEHVADMCDQVFPERRGWFREYYEESRTWTPPGFKDWREHEDKATIVRDWWPSIITGLGQTEDYARALLATSLGVTEEIIATRLAARMERQRRLLAREVQAWFIVDQLALYRLVGSPEVMAAQMRRLAEIAALPHATVQVLPAVAHPANASGFIVTDDAVLCEHVKGSFVYTDEQSLTSMARLFDTLRGECYRVSESLALLREVGELWTGESQPTQTPTAGRA